MHIVVVGAGIVGLSIAVGLAEAGAGVVVVDGGPPGARLTRTTFAWLNAGFLPVDRTYWGLRSGSLDAWHEASAGHPWFHAGGSLHLATAGGTEPDDRSAAWRAELRGWGEPIVALDAAAVHALEPALAGVTAVGGVAARLFRRDAWVETDGAIGHLVDRLLAAAGPGALRTGTPVARLEPGSGMPGVRLTSGETLHGDHVVVAAASDTPVLTGGGLVPVLAPDARGVPGLLVLTAPVAITVGRIVRRDDLVLRPAPGGRLLLQAGALDNDLRLDEPAATTDDRVRTLLARAAATLSRVDAPVAEQVTVAARALPPDGRPIVGWLDGARRTYVAVTHSGITLAPAIARIVIEDVLHGRRATDLDAYRPRAAPRA